jgi:hypothetical protein
LAPFQQPQPPYQSDQSRKRIADDAGMDSLASEFKIPKVDLNRPMDPGEHPLPTQENKGMSSVSANPRQD